MGGKRNQEERGERNKIRETEESLDCEVCGETMRSKAGLVNHIKRTHEISSQKATFKCNTCNKIYKYKGNLVTHRKICEGVTAQTENRKCTTCNKEFHYKNFARHKKSCGVRRQEAAALRELLGDRGPCSWCNKILCLKNISRHKKYIHLSEQRGGGALTELKALEEEEDEWTIKNRLSQESSF